jgi:hypothetical protein
MIWVRFGEARSARLWFKPYVKGVAKTTSFFKFCNFGLKFLEKNDRNLFLFLRI